MIITQDSNQTFTKPLKSEHLRQLADFYDNTHLTRNTRKTFALDSDIDKIEYLEVHQAGFSFSVEKYYTWSATIYCTPKNKNLAAYVCRTLINILDGK